MVMTNRQQSMPESFYTHTFPQTVRHGRTLLYLREDGSLRQLDMVGIMLAWRDSPVREPFGRQGLVVALVQRLRQAPQSAQQLPPFSDFDVLVLDTETGANRVFERCVMAEPPCALAVRFAVFDRRTGENVTPQAQVGLHNETNIDR